jgi:hypothetical protein
MRPFIRRGSIALALLVLAGVVVGVAFARSGTGRDIDVSREEAIEAAQAQAAASPNEWLLPLTDEERATVFDGVMRMPGIAVADVEPPDATMALPAWVALQELPSGVSLQIPMVEGYKFVKLDDRILLVNPGNRRIAAEMPRYKLVLN